MKGKVPGCPRETIPIFEFGLPPKDVLSLLNALLFVLNCTCTSNPIIVSNTSCPIIIS
jgi:hypothetical protein